MFIGSLSLRSADKVDAHEGYGTHVGKEESEETPNPISNKNITVVVFN